MNWTMRPAMPLRSLTVGAALSVCAAFAWSSAQAEMTLVRLTPEQYQHSIHDIFGTSIRVDQNKVEPGFRDEGLLALGNRKLTVGSAELERDETLAQAIATQVVDAKHRPVLVGCKPKAEDAPDDGCARSFITRVGLMLFRRPLTSDEVSTFVGGQNEAAQRLHSFDAGLAAALARMLVAPDFLFRVENSVPDPAHPGELQLDG